MSRRKIGLSLSGGGSRAIAFHLGCLKALHEAGVLQHVEVISTVSGGSVLGALYATNEGTFESFEKSVKLLLAQGLLKRSLLKIITSTEGVKALFCGTLLLFINSTSFLFRFFLWLVSFFLSPEDRAKWRTKDVATPVLRFASRTTILQSVLEDIFKHRKLRDLSSTRPLLIINAAELRTGSAFYFSSQSSGSWRLGEVAKQDITLAHAVTASAAYPLFLPTLDEELPFINKLDGSRRFERVSLTDGGVYDNLGLAPLWPDRSNDISFNVTSVNTIICCRAGYGLRFDPSSQFMIGRLKSAFTCIHDRAQNAGIKRLFDLQASGKIQFLLTYLGQDDSRLTSKPTDFVTREEVHSYPTDFSAMSPEWIERLSKRGEQLMKLMIAQHLR